MCARCDRIVRLHLQVNGVNDCSVLQYLSFTIISHHEAEEETLSHRTKLHCLYVIRVYPSYPQLPYAGAASKVPFPPVDATASSPFAAFNFSSNFANSCIATSSSWSMTCCTPFTSSI